MGYRRGDRAAAGGFPLLALGAKLGVSALKKVGAKLARSRGVRAAAKVGGALTVGAIPMPGGSALKRAGRGLKAAVGPGERKKSRRMNAGNAKAARRAIRRIKSVRSLLQSIEKQLPKRAASKPRGKACR